MKHIVLNFLLLLGVTNVQSVFAHYQTDSLSKRAEVDPLILEIDSLAKALTREKLFVDTNELQRLINIPPDQLPHYSDAEMTVRMKQIPSLFKMDYNRDVKAFIDLFVYRRRELMTKLLASSQIYFPVFEQILDEKGMPDELKYLALIESALNPNAVSHAGAAGIWQLMNGTGRLMGCDINSYVDERRDPVKSTYAAVKYLEMLHSIYGDWQLAIAAYNSGPGYVSKAIARSGSKNFWVLRYYLPQETRSYVPTFIAMAYAMHYAKDYKLEPAEPKRELYAVDTVKVYGKVSLVHVAKILNLPLEELQFLNPSLRTGIIPMLAGGFPLNLPITSIAKFEAKKNQILDDPSYAEEEAIAQAEFQRIEQTSYYRVRSGDNLGTIAHRQGVTISQLRSWNHLNSNYLKAGQKLRIIKNVQVPVYNKVQAVNTNTQPKVDTLKEINDEIVEESDTTNVEPKAQKTETAATPKIATAQQTIKKSTDNKILWYKVQSGDTLWSIMQRYPGITVSKIKSDNGLRSNTLQKGQVLKIVM
ncbi:MAG TPA: LysM peptidoglycan-binding domain-containing protein [Chitinophagales bacterium]